MVVLTGIKKGLGLKIRKRLGKAGKRPIFDQVLFDHKGFNSSSLAPRPDSKDVYGIYRVRHRWGKIIQEKMPFYVPTNPQKPAQQAWRGIFSDAVIAWQGLTEEQKTIYNKNAIGKEMSGYNLFLSEYLFSH